MTLAVSRTGSVAYVTLIRPEVHNAFGPGLIAAIARTFDALSADEQVRAIVIAGEGPSFCAGADLGWMRECLSYSAEENRADALRLAAMLEAIATCPHPVIARVHGAALGGGVGLVCAADIAVAADDARFGFTEARLGLAPAVIAPYAISRIGPGHARALFLTAERFDAAHALAIGLVHRVVPAGELDAAIESTVRSVLAGGPEALRACKALARAVPRIPADEVAAQTTTLIARLRTDPEGQEGIRAFLEKRRPAWAEDPGR